MSQRHRIYLVDTSVYIFHAWFGMPESITDRNGEPVNALYGFTHFLADLLAETRPRYIAGFFDESLGTCFRHQLYPQYKANRELPTENLKYQFSLCKLLLRKSGIRTYASKRYEADDLIASVTRHMSGHPVTIISADKDLAQCLVNDSDEIWHFRKSPPLRTQQVKQHYGVHTGQIADYLALCGDSIDNIPGIRGVGPKTASRLLDHFGDITTLLEYTDQVPDLGIRGQTGIVERIARHKNDLRLFQKLTRLRTSALGKKQVSAGHLKRSAIDRRAIHELLVNQLGLSARLSDKLLQSAKF